MLSKIAPITLLGVDSTQNTVHNDRKLIRRFKSPHPKVREGDCTEASYAIDRLKAGPADIPEVMSSGTKYNDPWTGKDVLYKAGYPTSEIESEWGGLFDDGSWTYERWTDVARYEDAVLFNYGTPVYTDPRQSGAGT